MTDYRKLWVKHNGPIPKDWEGRSYDIHHIDKNRKHNVIENLRCVTIREHYDIHWFQGDYNACLLIALKMKLSPLEISTLASEAIQLRFKNGFSQKGELNHMFGKHHSKEWSENHSKKLKGVQKGKKGSEHASAKAVIFVDPNDIKYHVIGVNQFCRDNNLDVNVYRGRLFRKQKDLRTKKHPWRVYYEEEVVL